MRGWQGDAVPITFPAALVGAVRTLARDHDVTVFAVLLAAFQALLARYTGRTDVAGQHRGLRAEPAGAAATDRVRDRQPGSPDPVAR